MEIIPKNLILFGAKKNNTMISQEITPDDKIRGILSVLCEGEKSIPFNDKSIQITIYNFKKEYPDFFKDFSFKLNGTYPYSDRLERSLLRSKISRTIKTANPDFIEISIRDDVKKEIDRKIISKFDENEKKIIVSVANEIRENTFLNKYGISKSN